MTRTRLTPEVRLKDLLGHVLEEARSTGYNRMTREGIAKRANVSPGLISSYFGTMVQLRRTVIRHAIERQDLPVLRQALALRDPHALKAPADLQTKAIASLSN